MASKRRGKVRAIKVSSKEIASDALIHTAMERLQVLLTEKTFHMTQEELSELVSQGIKKARAYRIFGDYDVIRFIDAMAVLGENLEQSMVYRDILNDPDLTGTQKLNKIEELMLFSEQFTVP